jgi:two-component system, cell cycle response regulator
MIKVLVADDDASIRSLVQAVLEEDGYVVRTAADGEEALHIFGEFVPDLVITDQRMPGLSGLELLAEVRARNPLTNVVIMTSYASLENAISALKQGAYDYLLKPFESLDLITYSAARAVTHVRLMREKEELLESLRAKNEELHIINEQLSDQALKDALTGLYNHRFAQEAVTAGIEHAKANKRPISALFVDVDHFKQYNDTYGHQQGDRVLSSIGAVLKKSCRPRDIAARWGGEEFIILLPDTDIPGAISRAERLRTAVSELGDSGRHTQPGGVLSVSIGVASLPEHADGADGLLFQADSALYEAKRAGRNTVKVAQGFRDRGFEIATGPCKGIGRSIGKKSEDDFRLN